MKARTILLAVLAASSSALACAATQSEEEAVEGKDAITTVAKIKPVWKGPAPGSKNNDLDEQGVLAGWNKMKETFYDKPGLSAFDAKGTPVAMPLTDARYPKSTEWAQCMGNSVPNWSDLMMHFYCSMPSYAVVTPNVRGCFSYIARAPQGPVPVAGAPPQAGFEQRLIFYPEIYDFCLFQPYDYARATSGGAANPVFDTAEIDKNKAAGNKVGVLKWIDDNIQDAFKHVLFTWYEPATYKFEQQQNVINAFWGVTLANKAYGPTDAADIAACKAKRPRQSADGAVPDGMQCSSAKSQAAFVSGEAAAAGTDPKKAYDARLNYMKTSVTTQPYTPSKI